eukprot:3217318-Rhodomonas_salina.1
MQFVSLRRTLAPLSPQVTPLPSLLPLSSFLLLTTSWTYRCFYGVSAITLWPFIFIAEGYDNEVLINHEKIHISQANEMVSRRKSDAKSHAGSRCVSVMRVSCRGCREEATLSSNTAS